MKPIETQMLTILDTERDHKAIATAGELLRSGGTVIIPTETVYGLAANACDPIAVAKIFEAKGRPQDNPLIVHIDSMDMLPPLVTEVSAAALLLAERFWPGPLTIILPKSEQIPLITSGGLSTVAIRMPESEAARAIIAAAGVPLAAPSANRSGSPSPTTFAHCVHDMQGRVDAIVEGEPCAVGVESTVITLATPVPRLLRPGAVTLAELQEVLGEVELDKGVLEQLDEGERVSSPGMKYKHYAPKAEVILLKGSAEAFAAYVNSHAADGCCAVCFAEEQPLLSVPAICCGAAEDYAEQARRLFDLLRGLDDTGITKAYIHAPRPEGIGLAVYNRLIRSAGFQILEL
ncbi:MAG: L-threonylcarbamoyladenylate synthase [Angelakisella sp.]